MVSNPEIDRLYDEARAAGALGGKLCGAGSGGFLLLLVPPGCQDRFRERMRRAVMIPVGLDTIGSTILTG
jgi:D-glycero-alpha-D-manno-heptose-7-phosphate kinase